MDFCECREIVLFPKNIKGNFEEKVRKNPPFLLLLNTNDSIELKYVFMVINANGYFVYFVDINYFSEK